MVRGKEEPNLQSPLSKLRRDHPLKAGGGKEGGERERKSERKKKALIAEKIGGILINDKKAIKKSEIYSDEGDIDYLEGAQS